LKGFPDCCSEKGVDKVLKLVHFTHGPEPGPGPARADIGIKLLTSKIPLEFSLQL
jgi:hypothetical protein